MRTIIPVLLAAFLLLPTTVQAEGKGHAWGRQCDAGAVPVLKEQMSGIHEAEVRLIEDEAEWCALWEQVYGNMFPQPPCDTSRIDFDEEWVLAVGIGDRPNSCYGVSIPCVQALGASGNVRVHVEELVPEEGCACLAVVVQPVEAVKLPRPLKNAQLRQEIVTLECP